MMFHSASASLKSLRRVGGVLVLSLEGALGRVSYSLNIQMKVALLHPRKVESLCQCPDSECLGNLNFSANFNVSASEQG